ncbi:MAG: chromosome segregation protein SMC [Snowella sp.]|nr:MAG: chromosome segregation protein SMC [Snowella sp.]
MIQEITIENYKSIQSLSIELGRVTVVIGENGCGKSNILEAVALGSAAATDKLDKEFLAPRGIRVTDPKLMRSAFDKDSSEHIKVNFKNIDNQNFDFSFEIKGKDYPSYKIKNPILEQILEQQIPAIIKQFEQDSLLDHKFLANNINSVLETFNKKNKSSKKILETEGILNFILFALEFSKIQNFKEEGQILPLGIHGEGLFKYIQHLSLDKNKKNMDEIKEKLELIDWFEDFEIPDNLYPGERTLKIKDRYLDSDLEYFDQKSANEGFLFLLFYFCLFIGEETPKFFAIDNIDSSLNPRLCRRLIQELVELAKKYDKQVILTTHNPSVLDGLDLDDQEQKLYVIKRKRSGQTKAIQIFPPKPLEGQEPVRLSEAFLRGYIGGLPKSF